MTMGEDAPLSCEDGRARLQTATGDGNPFRHSNAVRFAHDPRVTGQTKQGCSASTVGKEVEKGDGSQPPGGGGGNGKSGPVLSPNIVRSFRNDVVRKLMQRTLEEDLRTFGVPASEKLAVLTLGRLRDAGAAYPAVARELALTVYPKWHGVDVRRCYHDYNWRVERAGSAAISSAFIRGRSHVDIGGGPGTFALEVLKRKEKDILEVTVADIDDYRNQAAKAHPAVSFQLLRPDRKLPFQDRQFDSGSLLYVLHHVEKDHVEFLRDCARCVRDTLVIFEDVTVDMEHGMPTRQYRVARPLEADFLALPLDDQEIFIAGVDYICNHIASQALTMPVPGKYYEFHKFGNTLEEIFPGSIVTPRYHGIYDQKCYPNPEAMYIVEFQRR